MNQDKTAEIKEAPSCNLAAMTPAQRKKYDALKKRLRSSAKEIKELPNGYALRYGADKSLVLAAAEFITLESRCCHFYAFTLDVEASGGPIWLRITGPKEGKSFIKDALGI